MTAAELTSFVDTNPHIKRIDHEDDGCIGFRNDRLAWYRNDPARQTVFDGDWLAEHTTDELSAAINQGLEIEQMTRVTGYYAKVSSWNPGKKAELRDRAKWTIGDAPVAMQAVA